MLQLIVGALVLLGTPTTEPTDGRSTSDVADRDLPVPSPLERPMHVRRDGLPDDVAEAVVDRTRALMEKLEVVGLSVAIVTGGEIRDVRSFGWQDFHRRVPATHETMYRWASTAKAVTGALAVLLAAEGELDLTSDVRAYVPEFPEKAHTVTVEQLLSHQGGIVHYQHDPIRTLAEYDEAHPFEDRIAALDMFKESPLLFEPGTRFSYSTHGFALAGAALQRAAGERYATLVDERIATPLGMDSFQPDFQSVDIPNRSRGYRRTDEGQVVDSGDDDIAWKLAGGGFISTIEDMARFGVGLMGDELLDEHAVELMCTSRRVRGGRETGYGLGIAVRELRGHVLWRHLGNQRKASTVLALLPELGLGVCVMCNTEGSNLRQLSSEILALLLDEREGSEKGDR